MENANPTILNRRELMQNVISIMKEDVLHNVETQVDELIQQSGMPQRTFYYNFKQITGESPKRFIKNLKIKKVREKLIASKKGMNTIQEIAAIYGFHHMGQFGQDYKNVIGELPSETFKKIAPQTFTQSQEK